MQLHTPRFGELTVDPSTFIHFPLGLLGFESCQRFVLLEDEAAEPMRWLQSIERPEIAFLIVEPGLFFPDYKVSLSEDERNVLELGAGEEPLLSCLVVIPDDPRQMTMNMLGPLVFNTDKRLGKQLVLHDGRYSHRQRLMADGASSAETPALV